MVEITLKPGEKLKINDHSDIEIFSIGRARIKLGINSTDLVAAGNDDQILSRRLSPGTSGYSGHGSYEITEYASYFVTEAQGPFNEETLLQYRDDLKDVISNISGRYEKWGQIIFLHDEALFTPEAAEILVKSNSHRKSLGLDRCALIVDSVSAKRLVIAQMSSTYRMAGVRMQYFNSIVTAEKWIMSDYFDDEGNIRECLLKLHTETIEAIELKAQNESASAEELEKLRSLKECAKKYSCLDCADRIQTCAIFSELVEMKP